MRDERNIVLKENARANAQAKNNNALPLKELEEGEISDEGEPSGKQRKLNTNMLAADVVIEVTQNSREHEVDVLSEEELDYEDDVDEYGQPPMAQETEESFLCNPSDVADSEIHFNPREEMVREKQPKNPIQFNSPEELKSYVQQLVNNKWEQKEKELLKKHGIADGQNVQDKRGNGKGDADRLKSPSDTTLYAPALNRTPTRPFNTQPKTIFDQNSRCIVPTEEGKDSDQQVANIDMVEQISNFVENARIEDQNCRANQDD